MNEDRKNILNSAWKLVNLVIDFSLRFVDKTRAGQSKKMQN